MRAGKRRGAERGKQERRPKLRGRDAPYQVNTTMGDLIAAAFDIVGNEVRLVAQLVSSSDMARVTGRRILLV
ncbi:MAG TPA: chaperonin [Myxococcaceae bacterium]|nr:chaperonin [Myxococcaceae bacterium]